MSFFTSTLFPNWFSVHGTDILRFTNMSSNSFYLLMPDLSHTALSLVVLSVCASPPQPVSAWYFWFTRVFSFFHLALFLCSFLSFPFLSARTSFLTFFFPSFFGGFVSVLVCLFWSKVLLALRYPSTCKSPALSPEVWDWRCAPLLIPCFHDLFLLHFQDPYTNVNPETPYNRNWTERWPVGGPCLITNSQFFHPHGFMVIS